MFSPGPLQEDAVCEAAAETRVAWQQAVLQELAQLGMRMARAICAEAEAPADPDRKSSGDLALMFSRVSKAVRQTLALESRLAEGLEAGRAQRAAEAVGRAEAEGAARTHRKQSVRLMVEDAIDYDGPGDAEAQERLLDDLDERLADPVEEDRFRDRPIEEWVAHICQTLGVPFDPRPWEREEWGLDDPTAPPPGPPDARSVTQAPAHPPPQVAASPFKGHDPPS
jgi:hypothetical protein